MTNEKFRRDLFHQLGSFHISEGSQLEAAKTMFRKSPIETYGITSNEDGSELTYSDDPMSRKIKSIVDAGRQMLINESVSRDEPTDSQATSGDNKIVPVEFNHQDAFEDIFRQTNQSGPIVPQLSMSMEDFDQLEPMVGTPSGITLNLGSDKLVGATMVNRGPEGDIGKLVGQYMQIETFEVLDTSKMSEEDAAEYRAQGQDWMVQNAMMNKTEEVFYYKVQFIPYI